MTKDPTQQIIAEPDDSGIGYGLDGITIMRYAHVYRSRTSGGVEQYLRHLDRGLLQNHRMTILQTHLSSSEETEDVEIEKVGMGQIIWVPIPVRQARPTLADLPKRIGYIAHKSAEIRRKNGQKGAAAISGAMTDLIRHRGGHLRYSTAILSDYLSLLMTSQRVDLLSLHWLSYETGGLAMKASRAGVPFLFINHFDNARFALSHTRKWIARAAGVAAVSDTGIPADLRANCVSLSDAVDTDFFDSKDARSPLPGSDAVVLLPGRITEGKGHQDLLVAASILARRKRKVILCFVGAVESESLLAGLRRQSAALGLAPSDVLFLGEISPAAMRDRYSMSTLVVLPSYSEGLPRVILEAQSMKKAVVAYDSGGTSEALSANITGFLVPAGNVEALADKIDLLLSNEAERVRMGEAGRAFVSQHFSVPALIRRHEAFYAKALSVRSTAYALAATGRSVPVRRAAVSNTAPCVLTSRSLPMVSILIPAFNAQDWIGDTLRSVIGQTWPCKEIIVVDDGSTDRTVEIARQFESPILRVLEKENAGAAAARNKAFSLSTGDYIQWLDADDLLAPDKVERQMELARECKNKKILLSSAWGQFMHRYYRAKFIPTDLWCDLSPVEWLLRKMGQNLYMQTASWLVSRELTEAAGPWNTRLLSDDDGEYFCRVLMAGEAVRFVPEARTYYRGPGLAFRSLSYIGQSRRKIDAHWLSMQIHINYLLSMEQSERARAACLNYLQTSLIHFFPERPEIVSEVQQVASRLGGRLSTPSLSWKYSWMRALFGWRAAKKGQQYLLQLRWASERFWDRAIFQMQANRLTPMWNEPTYSNVNNQSSAI
jgi:glycosyltransferase involved in cell wall biosynthesis